MYPCEIQEQALRQTLSIRFRASVKELPEHFTRVYAAITHYIRQRETLLAGPAFAIYYNLNMRNLDIEAGFPVNRPMLASGEIQFGEIPAGTFAVCHYTGPYNKMNPAYEELTSFATDKGYKPGKIAYEWYLNGPGVDPENLRTDIAFPVSRVAMIASV